MLTVSCPGCSARYRLTDDQVAGRARVKLRCTRCQRVFEAEIPAAGASLGAVAASASPTTAPTSPGSARPMSSGGQAAGISGFENLFDEKAGLSALTKEEEAPSLSFAGDMFDNPIGSVAPAKLTAAMAPVGPAAPARVSPERSAPAPAGPRRGDDFPRLNPQAAPGRPSPQSPATESPALPRSTQFDAPQRDNLGNFDFGDEPPVDPGRAPGGGLDPMVEFHDVFREARGGDDAQARRYAKSDMFAAAGGGPIKLQSTGAGVARDGDVARKTARTPALDEGLAASRTPGADAPDDDIVQRLLASSNAREPITPPTAAGQTGAGNITPVDLTGERTGAGVERLDPGPRLLGTALALAVAFIAAAGYVAWRNHGILDLNDPAAAIAAAMGEVPATAESDSTAARIAVVAEGSAGDAPLPQVGELTVSRYVTEAGVAFVVVDGEVEIPAGSTYRRLDVDVISRVAGRDAATRRARAGAVLDSLALERSGEGSGLDARYASAVEAAADQTFVAGDRAPFRAVFDSRQVPDGAEFVAVLGAASRAVEAACWSEIRWRDAEGSAASPTE